MPSFMRRQAPTGFDDKAVVGSLQLAASKQTFNFDNVQDCNAAGAAGRQCRLTGNPIDFQSTVVRLEFMLELLKSSAHRYHCSCHTSS